MRSALPRSIAVVATVFGLTFLQAEDAVAGPIAISPVTITLAPPARAAQITIKNPSDEPLRLQLSASTWSEGTGGSIELTPTHDVIVFPALVTVPAFGTQEIRAAILSAPTAMEKAYRVVIDVLPPAPGSTVEPAYLGPRLNIRTRFTIPVFEEPQVPRPSGTITSATVSHGTMAFAIENSGNTHLGGDDLRIIGRNGDGRVAFSQPFSGWAILVNNKRTFAFRVPKDECRTLRSLTFAPPASMNVPSRTVEMTPGACGA